MTTIERLDELDGEPHASVFPDAEPKTIRLTLDEDEGVPPHTHPGRDIVLYLLQGRLELTLGDDTHEVEAGDVAHFAGEQDISPRALEPSVALLVLASRAAD